MASALAIHVGQTMIANLEIAIANGTWGCPGPQNARLAVGDYVLFGGGVPGGPRQSFGPRQSLSGGRAIGPNGTELSAAESWMTQTASFLVLCRSTSSWYEEETPIWEGPTTYKYRFDFELVERFNEVSLTPNLNLSSEASRSLQLSSLGGGKGGHQCKNFDAEGLFFLKGGVISEVAENFEPVPFQGNLDVHVMRAARAEQYELRTRLLNKNKQCSLCGRTLPSNLLVAAHIKKRSECSNTEKRDLDNIAMLACVLGCDALFEHGYIVVNENGFIKLNPFSETAKQYEPLFSHLVGRRCLAHTQFSKDYFSWHRKAHK